MNLSYSEFVDISTYPAELQSNQPPMYKLKKKVQKLRVLLLYRCILQIYREYVHISNQVFFAPQILFQAPYLNMVIDVLMCVSITNVSVHGGAKFNSCIIDC